MAERVRIAVMAKAPVPGRAKTRLIPALGAAGAAVLATRLLEHAVQVASAAQVGPVTLWGTPDAAHPLFRRLAQTYRLALRTQPNGDLGARMHAAVAAAGGPVLVIGTDCPALEAAHLRKAAAVLRHHDAVVTPAEDGGYVLIGLRRPEPSLFSGMAWGTASVMDEARLRFRATALRWHELPPLWDVDVPADLARMRRTMRI